MEGYAGGLRRSHSFGPCGAANLGHWFPPFSRDKWRETLKSSVSGVSMDALLFSQSGMPLVHRYGVFSRAGTHICLRGIDPDIQHGVHRRELEDLSPRCKTRRALSPSPATSSATTRDSVDVSTPVLRSRLYGRETSLPPIDLQLPKFADKDFIPDMLQSMWVAMQEYPASPRHWPLSLCVLIWRLGGGRGRCSWR